MSSANGRALKYKHSKSGLISHQLKNNRMICALCKSIRVTVTGIIKKLKKDTREEGTQVRSPFIALHKSHNRTTARLR